MDRSDIESLIKIRKSRDDSYIRVIVNIEEESLDVKKLKFLINRETEFCSLISIIRKRITINDSQSMFLFIDNNLIIPSKTLGEIYDRFGNKDYISIFIILKLENTFGE